MTDDTGATNSPATDVRPAVHGPAFLATAATPLPLHLRWQVIALVIVGGAVGTFARYELTPLLPGWHGVPLSILAINVVGAFLLGWLLESLVRIGPDGGLRRLVRLGVGTGVLGGFTTYSTFAVGAEGLFSGTHVAWGLVYAVATVVLGAAASFAGILAGSARGGSR